ncbi:MAG: 50S ribosomal protein L11 methyltransferase [Pseudomonadota bacterium]
MSASDAGWWQYRLVAAAGDAEAVEQNLFDSGALSVTLLDAEDQPILEPGPGETPLWDRVALVGLYAGEQSASRLAEQIGQALGRAVEASQLERLADEAWERSWMAHFKPMHFGGSLWIVPSYVDAPDPAAVNVQLDPGLAFGTGTHPTTALCLRHLAETPPRGLSVVDYGCGSGVLAVAALKLGAARVWATDLDDQALEATRSNAQLNGVLDGLCVTQPSGEPEWAADLLLANILHGPLVALRDTLVQRVKQGGTVVLSGVLSEQVETLQLAYCDLLTEIEVATEGDWSRLSGRVI